MQACLSLELCVLEKEEVFTRILIFFLFLWKKKSHVTKKSGVKDPCCERLSIVRLFIFYYLLLFLFCFFLLYFLFYFYFAFILLFASSIFFLYC